MIKIIFVCLGNICRSPTAASILQNLLQQYKIEKNFLVTSAGTASYHIGQPAEPRAIATAKKYGINLTNHLAKQLCLTDYKTYDYIITCDKNNYNHVQHTLAQLINSTKQIYQLASYLQNSKYASFKEIPDPYYGTLQDFDLTFNIIKVACHNLLQELNKNIVLK